MAEQKPTVKWYQIVRADSKSGKHGKIIDITDPNPYPSLQGMSDDDADNEDKRARRLAINYRRYDPDAQSGARTLAQTRHWLTVGTMSLLVHQMLNLEVGTPSTDTPTYSPILEEYKGGEEKLEADSPTQTLVSRVLQVRYTDHMKIGEDWQPKKTGASYDFCFRKGPGVRNDAGAVMPKKGAELIINETFSLAAEGRQAINARIFAILIRDYLAGKIAAAQVLQQLHSSE